MPSESTFMPECERCVYFRYDEEADMELCDLSFDEDELLQLYAAQRCPYFRLYDEYGTVRKQN